VMGACRQGAGGGLSWEAQEVLQKIKSFNRLPGAGIPLIQLNMLGGAKTVKKGIPELKSAGLITDMGEPTLFPLHAWGEQCGATHSPMQSRRPLPNGSQDRERKNKHDQQPPEREMPPYRRRRYFRFVLILPHPGAG
jgi:hypothetical protein